MSKSVIVCLTAVALCGGAGVFYITELSAKDRPDQIAVTASTKVSAKNSIKNSTELSTKVECHFAYRASTRRAKMEEQSVIVDIPASNGDEIALAIPPKVVEFDQFRVEIRYQPGSLVLHVSEKETRQPVCSHLYQIDGKVRNQFAGGHGFTGLTYVHHSNREAELQFWITAK